MRPRWTDDGASYWQRVRLHLSAAYGAHGAAGDADLRDRLDVLAFDQLYDHDRRRAAGAYLHLGVLDLPELVHQFQTGCYGGGPVDHPDGDHHDRRGNPDRSHRKEGAGNERRRLHQTGRSPRLSGEWPCHFGTGAPVRYLIGGHRGIYCGADAGPDRSSSFFSPRSRPAPMPRPCRHDLSAAGPQPRELRKASSTIRRGHCGPMCRTASRSRGGTIALSMLILAVPAGYGLARFKFPRQGSAVPRAAAAADDPRIRRC